MEQRFSTSDDHSFHSFPQTDTDGARLLRQMREESDALSNAAGDLLDRVLSRDAERLLRQASQYGGE